MVATATDSLTVNNLGLFNKITAPTTYSDEFIKDAKQLKDLSRYIYFSEVPVGVVVSKQYQPKDSIAPIGLVIIVLKVLKAYAGKFGLEGKLFDYIETLASQKKHLPSVYLLADPKEDAEVIEIAKNRGYGEDNQTQINVVGKPLESTDGKVLLKKVVN